MKSRLVAGIAAVVLALVGAIMVFSYANGAEARAVQNLEPVDVLVVQEAVPAGTPVAELATSVVITRLPGTSVAASALKDLESSQGLVTAVELVPGEQLLQERLVDPAKLETNTIDVPNGFHEISLTVEPHRIAGGKVSAGDVVGVFMSLPEGGIEARPEAESTQLVLPKALVSAVQRAPVVTTEADPTLNEQDAAAAQAEAMPSGSLIVTLAISADAATRVIFTSEFGTIWLSKATVADPDAPPVIIQDKELYR
ncbi:RcpC/CpaB family pilus assembly protein [Arthrobacter sp. EH-1B-1]|uniref:RcpC/CpaB family pilus assembly protein n=1 Tax=Arthrobacter vasquezii TaxID=2977629 RepID=A0ABT6CZD3_9MICC|nr:RcpC/CpaB family pilus assembly protein [Arthrobacter vasquezii]MDF9279238.1 RcpC/CpaB family pilus assembly protein [Arthrobacter vasquezii]